MNIFFKNIKAFLLLYDDALHQKLKKIFNINNNNNWIFLKYSDIYLLKYWENFTNQNARKNHVCVCKITKLN